MLGCWDGGARHSCWDDVGVEEPCTHVGVEEICTHIGMPGLYHLVRAKVNVLVSFMST